MAVHELYSKRKKRERGEMPDLYVYDVLPIEFRRQVVHIWSEIIGTPSVLLAPSSHKCRDIYHSIVQVLRREYGTFKLSQKTPDPANRVYSRDDLIDWFLSEKDTEKVLDAIELSFSVMADVCSRSGYLNRGDNQSLVTAAFAELNVRFRENGLGYELINGQIIRIDSLLLHKEAVLPALEVLLQPGFANAQQEFMSAFEHFRHGNNQEALVDCCKCFESTMKVICDKRGWGDTARATVSDLVRMCFDNGLIPPYWQNHFSGLRSVLESSIATPRNRQAGHGAGSAPSQELPDELVSYVLHMTAATVLFLTEAEKRLP